MDSKHLLINKMKDTFFSPKINEGSGLDEVTFNIFKNVLGYIGST